MAGPNVEQMEGGMNSFDREEQILEDELNMGSITQAEFDKEMRELKRDYKAEAEKAASSAYDFEMSRW